VIPVPKRAKKGDAESILEFLKSHEPLSEESAKKIMEAVEKGRKNAPARKFASTDS